MLSAGMSEHKSKKSFKKITKKKSEQISPIHPHIEHIQAEINLLQAELDELEAKGTETTNEEETKKKITKACLERYQNTLIKLTDSAIKDKLRIYHENHIEREIKYKVENQTLALLQFLYVYRLAQFGLFSVIQVDNATDKLLAVTDLNDQLIGASVYASKDPYFKTRSSKRKFVFETLKKFETGSEERVTTGNDVTFKQLKALFDDIWSNTIDEQKALDKVKSNDATWLAVPAHEAENGIVESSTSTDLKNARVEQQKDEDHVDQNGHEKSVDNLLNKKNGEAGSKTEHDENNSTETKEEEHEAQTEESCLQDNNTEKTAETEHEDASYDESDKKSAESDPLDNSWRCRSSDGFSERGRGSSTRGFKRGWGRGRFTRGRGMRGAPRGRGRGRGYDNRDEYTAAE
ncbi:hypothetical protein CU098_008359 [Rhizopus stolonifer]|uniref:Uncharacterized protein n=1 Tax=Rhizopus stolonifer TaxID=4846 RepID=A0A367JXG9_RHIST|nr:hypothetical protein CU098_008359 [Rhizopus stolonifer]